MLLSGAVPGNALAAQRDASFELYPHCLEREGADDDWIFGPIPSPGFVAETRQIEGVRCTEFEEKDPQTLQTRLLREGSILDIDIVIDNPTKQDIGRVRAWLTYDPTILQGESLEINDTFPLVTPGENDFFENEGYVKIEASADSDYPDAEKILFARVQFRVKKSSPLGTTAINFYDVQPGGHTVIAAIEGAEESYVLKQEPGVLLVRFNEESGEGEESEEGEEEPEDIDNIFDAFPEPEPEPEQQFDPEPEPGPLPDLRALPNGAICTVNADCESNLCRGGMCVPAMAEEDSDVFPSENSGSEKTAFSLLQIQNVRVTTEGSSAFLAWSHLRSSQLKAYNIYYGKQSGRYIQRRTIDKSENSITLRSLPVGEQYYFAVRGLSTQNEESAFSREVSVVIGDSNTSTAPLTLGEFSDGPGVNPVANVNGTGSEGVVPGETGTSSAILLFLLFSAAIGTTFASRRQSIISNGNLNA